MTTKKVFVAGHGGMVGSALVRTLSQQPSIELILRSSAELNLIDQQAVQGFFQQEHVDEMYICAAKVGGIHANNTYPAEFVYQNMMIQSNLIHSAHLANVQKILFLGSSCIYPRDANQPIDESELLSAKLELTNEPYAIAKIAGIKMCESYNRQYDRDYRSVMPTNLYGPNDNFHPENSHVIPGLLRRFHEAKEHNAESVAVWGSGRARREFLYVDDMANACQHVMNCDRSRIMKTTSERQSHLNIGMGEDVSIAQLATLIAEVVGYTGQIQYDSSKPDGTPQKLLNIKKLQDLGWQPTLSLAEGLVKTYDWYLRNQADAKS